MATRGSYVHNSYGRIFGGIPKMLVLCNFLIKLMVSDKRFTGLLELIQLYKQNPLENFFIFTMHLPKLYIGFNIIYFTWPLRKEAACEQANQLTNLSFKSSLWD